MIKKQMIFSMILFLCIILFAPDVLHLVHAESQTDSSDTMSSLSYYERTAYSEYYNQYKNEKKADIKVDAILQEAIFSDGQQHLYHNKKQSDFGIEFPNKELQANIPINVIQEGLYQLKLEYCPIIDSGLDIYVDITIDGKSPFTEAAYCHLNRVYNFENVMQDQNGNDITPSAVQIERWFSEYMSDSSGIYGNYYFYLTAGTHSLGIESNGIGFLLKSAVFCPAEENSLTYKEYQQQHINKKTASKYQKIYSAENVAETSEMTVQPDIERTSPLLEPFDYKKDKVNILNGEHWISPGDWVSWKFEVPKDGFYQIAFKARQSYLDGLFSVREIRIDGKIPFEELKAVNFNYSTKWELVVLGEEKPFQIYLTKGEHILTLKNVLGDLSETIRVLEEEIDSLNELYLNIIEVTGSEPDENRDYYLSKQLPDISERFNKSATALFNESKRLNDIVGIKGAETAVLDDIAYQLQSYANDITGLTHNSRIDSFRNNITTLSSKITGLKQQGLDLDYFVISTADMEMPSVKQTFVQWLTYSIRTFLGSFMYDYSNNDDKDNLKVWISGGQEQLEIVSKMTREKFTVKTGIPVSVQLVSGSLLNVVVSGKNPDVALNIDSSVPVNFALRGALEDLSNYNGYKEVENQYRVGSFVPYTINGAVYGIPATESFAMLFVRDDIFAKFGLSVPQTWEDILDLAPILQRKNMSIGLGVSFSDLIFQNGGNYYNDELTKVCFNDNICVDAFKTLTAFYVDYGFPITYDFLTRFRSGEMPIGISTYSTYNSLEYTAPEIKGLWSMYEMIGTVKKDGSIDKTGTASPIQVSVMFSNSVNKKDAWEFLKWWADSSTQTTYGLELEAALGVSARYETANTETFKSLLWTASEQRVLLAQRDRLKTLPILPGTYYVERCYNNAYRSVINQDQNPREALNKWTVLINEELARKQAEFDKNNS